MIFQIQACKIALQKHFIKKRGGDGQAFFPPAAKSLTTGCPHCRRHYLTDMYSTGARAKNLMKTLVAVLFQLVPPAHAPNHRIACDLCHTSVKALFIEPLSLLSPAQSIVLALHSQLPTTHPTQHGDDSPRKNQRMQISLAHTKVL